MKEHEHRHTHKKTLNTGWYDSDFERRAKPAMIPLAPLESVTEKETGKKRQLYTLFRGSPKFIIQIPPGLVIENGDPDKKAVELFFRQIFKIKDPMTLQILKQRFNWDTFTLHSDQYSLDKDAPARYEFTMTKAQYTKYLRAIHEVEGVPAEVSESILEAVNIHDESKQALLQEWNALYEAMTEEQKRVFRSTGIQNPYTNLDEAIQGLKEFQKEYPQRREDYRRRYETDQETKTRLFYEELVKQGSQKLFWMTEKERAWVYPRIRQNWRKSEDKFKSSHFLPQNFVEPIYQQLEEKQWKIYEKATQKAALKEATPAQLETRATQTGLQLLDEFMPAKEIYGYVQEIHLYYQEGIRELLEKNAFPLEAMLRQKRINWKKLFEQQQLMVYDLIQGKEKAIRALEKDYQPLYDPIEGKRRDDIGGKPKDYSRKVRQKMDAFREIPLREQLQEAFMQRYFRYQFITKRWKAAKEDYWKTYTGTNRRMQIRHGVHVPGSDDAKKNLYQRADELYWETKAEFEAVSRAYLLNEDPGYTERSGFWGAFAEGLAEATFWKNWQTEDDFIQNFVKVMQSEKSTISAAQMERLRAGLDEMVGKSLGASLPSMLKLIAISYMTSGLGSALAISRAAAHLTQVLTARFGTQTAQIIMKGLQFSVQTGKSALDFELAGIGAAAGVGEHVGQKFFEKALGRFQILPQLLKNKAVMQLLVRNAQRVAGGTAGETISEYSGELLTALAAHGLDMEEVFKDTFGRNWQEAKDKFLTTVLVSALFSQAANMPRVISSLQQELQQRTQVLERKGEAASEKEQQELKEYRQAAEILDVSAIRTPGVTPVAVSQEAGAEVGIDRSGLVEQNPFNIPIVFDENAPEGVLTKSLTIRTRLHPKDPNYQKMKMEEFGHLWTLIALRKEPALIGQFLADPRIKAGIQNLQSDPFYGEKIARAANPEHYALVELLGQAIRYEGGNPEGLSLNQGYMDLLQSIIQHPSFSKIWELVKKFLKDIGIDLSSKDLAKLSLEEFLEYASQEVKSGESLSDATRQQLLDFLEGKTSSVHISDRSILGTQEAKEGEGITMEDWYIFWKKSPIKQSVGRVNYANLTKTELEILKTLNEEGLNALKGKSLSEIQQEVRVLTRNLAITHIKQISQYQDFEAITDALLSARIPLKQIEQFSISHITPLINASEWLKKRNMTNAISQFDLFRAQSLELELQEIQYKNIESSLANFYQITDPIYYRSPVGKVRKGDVEFTPNIASKAMYHGTDFSLEKVYEVFEKGLPARGINIYLDDHVAKKTLLGESAFRGTTEEVFLPGDQGAGQWADDGGYVFVIDGITYWNANSILEGRREVYTGKVGENLSKGEQEFIILAHVPKERIQGVIPIYATAFKGLRQKEMIPNPNYKPLKTK